MKRSKIPQFPDVKARLDKLEESDAGSNIDRSSAEGLKASLYQLRQLRGLLACFDEVDEAHRTACATLVKEDRSVSGRNRGTQDPVRAKLQKKAINRERRRADIAAESAREQLSEVANRLHRSLFAVLPTLVERGYSDEKKVFVARFREPQAGDVAWNRTALGLNADAFKRRVAGDCFRLAEKADGDAWSRLKVVIDICLSEKPDFSSLISAK